MYYYYWNKDRVTPQNTHKQKQQLGSILIFIVNWFQAREPETCSYVFQNNLISNSIYQIKLHTFVLCMYIVCIVHTYIQYCIYTVCWIYFKVENFEVFVDFVNP